MILGELASLVLKGSRVSSEKVVASGFEFEFENLDSALEDLLGS
jgi:NAD dependent epimerase/dehydratase family enzyme